MSTVLPILYLNIKTAVLTLIRLLLLEQSDQGLHCLPFRKQCLELKQFDQSLGHTQSVLDARIFRNYTTQYNDYVR